MKILITGVLGVVGSKLEKVLLSKGYDVFGVDLYHTNEKYGHGLGSVEAENYFRCDISEYRQVENVIAHTKPDFVYNCAAEFGRWNGEHFYEKVWKSNAIGMKNMIRLQEKHRFKMVHCSSSEVYGDYQGVMYEDVMNNVAIPQMNDYAMSKWVNEMQIKNSYEQFNTETVRVRLFNTYGPGEWYHPFRSVNCVFSYKLLTGQPITVFKGHSRTSTYIDDCVAALANISLNFKNQEVYNLASQTEHTVEKLAELILKHTCADPSLVSYVDNKEILTATHKKVDAQKARTDLGMKESVTLEQGVENTIKWMRLYYGL
jgi:dTDP-glucose 4,6-dehydratase